MKSQSRFATCCCCSLAMAAVLAMSSQASAQLVVSQAYGDTSALGPNGDFVEILNNSCAAINLDGYSVQVTTPTSALWNVVPLPNFVLAAGQYYLIKLNTNTVGVATTPDLTASPVITSLTLTGGKIAIVKGDQPIQIIDTLVPSNVCPSTPLIIDFVRYANVASLACTEGLTLNVTGAAAGTGVARAAAGCTDTNVNSADFAVTAVGPVMRNSASPTNLCPGALIVGACNLANGSCEIATEAGCDTLGGGYGGDCSACAPMGACCLAGGCSITIETACTGTWFAGQSCGFNSYTMSTIPSNFIDISATGTLLTGIAAASDDGAQQVQLPFPVNFYGQTKTAYSVGVNGFISFNIAATAFTNVSIPATATPNDAIYAMWDDLNFRAASQQIRVQTNGPIGSRVHIIQWTDVPQRLNQVGSSNTFQIQLFENSSCIELHYSVVDGVELLAETGGTTVGVENATGTAATQLATPSGTECRASLAALVANQQGLRFCTASTTCVAGACCTANPDACTEVLQAVCLTNGGVYGGPGTTCAANACTGACCTANGVCSIVTAAACASVPGVYQGNNSNCGTVNYNGPGGAGPVMGPGGFIDISTTGTLATGASGTDDGASALIALPFGFNFYGAPVTQYWVNSNGFISFTPPATTGFFTNANIPVAATPNNAVYALWDDMLGNATVGTIHTGTVGVSPNQIHIIQWTNYPQYDAGVQVGSNTFQIQLFETSNCIELHYQSIVPNAEQPGGDTNGTTIGVENATGTVATQVFLPATGTRAALAAAMAVQPNQTLRIVMCPSGLTCPTPPGACCVNAVCSEITRAACQEAFGVFNGEGSSCTPNPCVTEACCLPQGGCSDLLVVACATAGGTPQGPGSNCGTTSCPPAGKCCTATGACSVTLQANCQAAGSTWEVGLDCTSPCVVGACCFLDGTCGIRTQAGCTSQGGVRWTGGATCTPNLCQGRCCSADGSVCAIKFPPGTSGGNSCEAPETYGGDGTNCTGINPCQGRCCAPDGTCTTTNAAGCVAPSTFGGLGTDCSNPDLCKGKCCQSDGTCTLEGPANCVAPDVFGGVGTNCTGAVCTGRCCLPNGTCSVTSIDGCSAISGVFSIGLDCSATTVYAFTGVNMIMADVPDGVLSQNVQTISSPTPLIITDLDVDMSAIHTWPGDVQITIEHLGTSVIVYDRPGFPISTFGCATDNFDIVLDDEGTGGAIEGICNAAPPSALSPPNYTPNNPLSAFDGLDAVGAWTITCRDFFTGGDTGTLLSWSLHVSTDAPVCPVVGCTCFGDMNGDSFVNGKDVAGFSACVIAGGGAGCACADMDHAGGVTTADIPGFIAALMAGGCGP